MAGQPSNNGFGGQKGDPGSLTDPLSFASRLFEQIGNNNYAIDDESRSESERSESEFQTDDDDDDDANNSVGLNNGSSKHQASTSNQLHKIGRSFEDRSSTGQQSAGGPRPQGQPNPHSGDNNDDHIAKRMRLEAVAQLISAGMQVGSPTAHTMAQPGTQTPLPFTLTPETLSLFNLAPSASSPNAAHLQQQRQQQRQQPPPAPQQHMPQAYARPASNHQTAAPPATMSKPMYSPPLTRPLPAAVLTPPAVLTLPMPKTVPGGKVIDLTEEDPLNISDDEVVIDESRTTAVANRNMCFGMIQSLVVTLYPRHLEYIEGKADRVIIKRATTANKASLAVEHESGLYGYIVSELAETLVPLVDANMIWWEASVPRVRKQNNVSAPVNIVIYGRPEYQMAVAKALYGKVRLEEPLAFDARTRYSNPLVPEAGEKLSPYDRWRGVTAPVTLGNGLPSSTYGYSGYSNYSGYGSTARSAEEIKNQIDGVFKGLRSATDLPEVEPVKMLSTTMYRHQKQALYFLLEREKQEDYSDNEKNKLTSLWRKNQALHRHPTYLNVVTSQETTIKPTSMLGGILADDMGLGKTITIISLIVHTLDRRMHVPVRTASSSLPAPTGAAPDFLSSGEQVTEYDSPPSPTIRPLQPTAPRKPMFKKRLTNHQTKSHATLIICPLSTVQNWEEQFETHVRKDSLQVYVYHGGQRVSDPAFLAKHDVVITTYNLLGSEYSKECKGRDSETGPSKHPSVLQHIDWFRVVLDEAHIIKEATTVQSKAACALKAERKWCLTGTPIQNKLDDLYALVKFLGMQPFHEKAHWTHYISKPIKAANPIGITRLQTLMKVITLRRTKTQMVDGKPLLTLPSRTDHMRILELSLNERQMYQRMESRAKQTVDEIVQENKIMKNYAHILQAILKLRQICAHYALVKNMYDDLDMSGEFNLAKAAAILSLLQDSGNDQCNQCFHPSTATPIVTRCEHIFCPECVKKLNPISFMLIQKGNANVSVAPELKTDFCCPQCASILKPVDLIQVMDDSEDKITATATEGVHVHSRTDEDGMFIHSTKVKALMDDLVEATDIAKKTGQPLVKSVVFSQWTSMLDLIEDGLRENNIKFTRLDGTMQRSDRTSAMINFKEKPEVSVILISLKAGGVGLNLTAAQRVYLMDPHWNPSVESQAIDRIHRLGQTKPVDVIRFIIKESIEENILELQKRKTELSDMTFAEKLSKQEVLKRRLEDLKYLFQGSSEIMRKSRVGVVNESATPSSASSPTSISFQ